MPATHSTSYTLQRGNDEFEIEVEYSLSPLIPGLRPSLSCPGEPPSGGEVEDLAAYHDGQHFDLTGPERTQVERHIYDTHDYSEDDYD